MRKLKTAHLHTLCDLSFLCGLESIECSLELLVEPVLPLCVMQCIPQNKLPKGR